MTFKAETNRTMKGYGATGPEPAFCSVEDWCALSGMGRRSTYEYLGSGELKAVKVGARTLIDVAAGLAWLRSRPPAVIRAPRERKPVAA